MLGKWVFLIEHWEISSPRLSSVFQGDCPDLGNNLAPSPSTFLLTNSVLEQRCACPQRGLLLQPLRWCCVDCMLHHERDVREEQKYLYVARTSNNRVIPMEWSWWVTSNNACEIGEQLIVLAKGDTRVISSGDLYCCLLPRCEALRTCRSGFPIATLWVPPLARVP